MDALNALTSHLFAVGMLGAAAVVVALIMGWAIVAIVQVVIGRREMRRIAGLMLLLALLPLIGACVPAVVTATRIEVRDGLNACKTQEAELSALVVKHEDQIRVEPIADRESAAEKVAHFRAMATAAKTALTTNCARIGSIGEALKGKPVPVSAPANGGAQ